MAMNLNIFRFNNGTADVFGDPLALRDRLFVVSQGEFWNLRKKVAAIASADAKTPEGVLTITEGVTARGHLVTIACETFGLPAFDPATGNGMLAEACLDVTEAFLAFLNQKKTTSEQPPTTSPSTESTPQDATQPITPTMSASS